MLLNKKIILGSKEKSLMVLEKHYIDFNINLENVKKELNNHIIKMNDSSATWGYFPQIKLNKEEYPECIKFAETLQKNFIKKLRKEDQKFELAFIRMATKTPVSEFGGFHVDVDKGILHKKEINQKKEIVRFLINFGDFPRTLEYTEVDRNNLNKIGLKISKTKYKVIQLPKNIEIKKVEIPSKNKNIVYALKFWASLIPHFGKTDDKGHFLVSYGMFADPKNNL